MITYHSSGDGSADYLDFGTPAGDRLYLPRHEMRALLEGLLADIGDDIVCEHCGRSNGVHEVRRDGEQIQWCAGHHAKSLTASDLKQMDQRLPEQRELLNAFLAAGVAAVERVNSDGTVLVRLIQATAKVLSSDPEESEPHDHA